jgi:hypothetical protein
MQMLCKNYIQTHGVMIRNDRMTSFNLQEDDYSFCDKTYVCRNALVRY